MSSWRDEALKRIPKVKKLTEECIKYIDLGRDPLANQIFKAVLMASSKADSPVKLSEVSEAVYGTSEKAKQDVIRLTMEKTLLKCGIVEKIYFSERDVRYFPSAYRFQEIRIVESNEGKKLEQQIGGVLELPREHWPVPTDFFQLLASRTGYEGAIAKLEGDYGEGKVKPKEYQQIKVRLHHELESLERKLKEYSDLSTLLVG